MKWEKWDPDVEALEDVSGDLKDGTTVVRVIGPDDFPWFEPMAILELYHGHFARWSWPRRHRIVPGTLIQPLIDSSLGTTPERREQIDSRIPVTGFCSVSPRAGGAEDYVLD